jgi:hypothetical protein
VRAESGATDLDLADVSLAKKLFASKFSSFSVAREAMSGQQMRREGRSPQEDIQVHSSVGMIGESSVVGLRGGGGWAVGVHLSR